MSGVLPSDVRGTLPGPVDGTLHSSSLLRRSFQYRREVEAPKRTRFPKGHLSLTAATRSSTTSHKHLRPYSQGQRHAPWL